jgi:hypothetical protein
MERTENSAPKDAPVGEEPEYSARPLVAAITGVGTVISLAFLVEAFFRG